MVGRLHSFWGSVTFHVLRWFQGGGSTFPTGSVHFNIGIASSRLCMVLNSNCASWSSLSGSLPANGESEPPVSWKQKNGRNKNTTEISELPLLKRDFSLWTSLPDEQLNISTYINYQNVKFVEFLWTSISVETNSHVVAKCMAGKPHVPSFHYTVQYIISEYFWHVYFFWCPSTIRNAANTTLHSRNLMSHDFTQPS